MSTALVTCMPTCRGRRGTYGAAKINSSIKLGGLYLVCCHRETLQVGRISLLA